MRKVLFLIFIFILFYSCKKDNPEIRLSIFKRQLLLGLN